jgi:anti-anti-sigma factor
VPVAPAAKAVGRVQPGDHLCLAYSTDEEQRDVLTPFLVAGLARGEKVLYLSDTTAPETVTAWLRGQNIDARPAWARGQLEMRRVNDSYLRPGQFHPRLMREALCSEIASARRAGFSGLWLAGEMSWATRDVPGAERLADYEAHLGPVFDQGGLTAICQYDRRLFGRDRSEHARLIHPWTLEPDPLHEDAALRIQRTYDPPGLAVIGTIDIHNCAAFAAVLRQWAEREPLDLHLDMAQLDFIDVAGLRVIVRTAGTLSGRALRIRNLAPALQHVMSIVGWDQAPGLLVGAGSVVA